MEKANLILNLAREGLPLRKIAETQNLPLGEVMPVIATAIQERKIKRSQMVATLDSYWQTELAVYLRAWSNRKNRAFLGWIYESLKESDPKFDLSVDELEFYLLALERPFRDGEIYEALCDIERTLHQKIRMVLMENHGGQRCEWWRKGVPAGVRHECVLRWEDDINFVEYPPYGYTTLGDLHAIIAAAENTKLFKRKLPLAANGNEPNMEVMLRHLLQLKKIRDRVMHPIGATPVTEDEFFFVLEMQQKLDLAKWR